MKRTFSGLIALVAFATATPAFAYRDLDGGFSQRERTGILSARSELSDLSAATVNQKGRPERRVRDSQPQNHEISTQELKSVDVLSRESEDNLNLLQKRGKSGVRGLGGGRGEW